MELPGPHPPLCLTSLAALTPTLLPCTLLPLTPTTLLPCRYNQIEAEERRALRIARAEDERCAPPAGRLVGAAGCMLGCWFGRARHLPWAQGAWPPRAEIHLHSAVLNSVVLPCRETEEKAGGRLAFFPSLHQPLTRCPP